MFPTSQTPTQTVGPNSDVQQTTTNVDPLTLQILAGFFGAGTFLKGISVYYHRRHDRRKAGKSNGS